MRAVGGDGLDVRAAADVRASDRRRCRVGGVTAGNSSVKRLPSPSLLSTRIRPPCSSRIFWLTGRPRPVPRPPLRETKTAKIFSRSSCSMPLPLSTTCDAGHLLGVAVLRRDFDAAVLALVAGVDGVGDDVEDARCIASGSNISVGIVGAGSQTSSTFRPRRTGLHQLDHVGRRAR